MSTWIGKLFEYAMINRLNSILKRCNIINMQQDRFRAGRSTILPIQNYSVITEAIEDNIHFAYTAKSFFQLCTTQSPMESVELLYCSTLICSVSGESI